MTRFLLAILVAACALGTATAATLDEVVASYLEARGGLDSIRAIRAYEFWGRVLLTDEEEPTRGWWEQPGKMRIDRGSAGNRRIFGYDGIATWTIEENAWGNEPSTMTPAMADVFVRTANFEGLLAGKRSDSASVKLDSTTHGQRPQYVITLLSDSGVVTTMEIDTATHLLTSERFRAGRLGFSYMVEARYADYRTVGGVTFAHRIERLIEGRHFDDVILDSIRIADDIPDSLFTEPAMPVRQVDTGRVTDLERVLPLRDSFRVDDGSVRLIALLSPT